ncbi:chaplin [Streptomyces sp. NPDC002514]|uniref:chaplin n=1 Tax=unclassified Streptomyces TaxID=2593676 RepID=UPI0036BD3C50
MNIAKKAAVAMAVAGIATGASAVAAFADSDASGVAAHSPGVASGNVAEIPVHVPVNAVGDSVNVVGLLNPAFGNEAEND